MSIILLDVDGVVADFTGMVAQVSRAGGFTLPPVTQWDFMRGLEAPHRAWVERCLALGEYWGSIEPLPGAVAGVDALRMADHDVVFVTSPWESCPTWAYERTRWLLKHFQATRHDVIVAADKSLISGDVFVDDKPEHVGSWVARNKKKYGFIWDQPWNAGRTEGAHLVGGWTEQNIMLILASA